MDGATQQYEADTQGEGCGKFIYHHIGRGNVHCQREYLCKECSPSTGSGK